MNNHYKFLTDSEIEAIKNGDYIFKIRDYYVSHWHRSGIVLCGLVALFPFIFDEFRMGLLFWLAMALLVVALLNAFKKRYIYFRENEIVYTKSEIFKSLLTAYEMSQLTIIPNNTKFNIAYFKYYAKVVYPEKNRSNEIIKNVLFPFEYLVLWFMKICRLSTSVVMDTLVIYYESNGESGELVLPFAFMQDDEKDKVAKYLLDKMGINLHTIPQEKFS